MSDISKRIANLSPDKRKLLAKQIAKANAGASQARSIPLRKPGDPLVLSFSQERLWFLDQLLPGNSMYNMSGAAHFKGPLDEDVLLRSLEEIVRRHEVLRATFQAVDGRPSLVFAPAQALIPRRIDLRATAEANREAEARRLMMEEAQRPFDLARGPLIRVTLLRLADDECIGLLTMHHIATDGWSTKVLFREFAGLYEAFSSGKPSPLPELPLQYADYALWQRQWLQGPALASQLAYWKQRFSSSAPALDLPADHRRPANPAFGGGRQPIVVSAALTRALEDLSRQNGGTLFMTLLAAFKTLLFRYTTQPDVTVGIPIAGRNRPELETLIGCFLNMLAVRTDMAGNPTFRELLGQVKEVTLGAYAHQDLPFEKLVDELQIERTMSHTPLYQVAFSFEDNPVESIQIRDLILHFEEIETGTTKMDLGLELTTIKQADGSVELAGWLEYSIDIFEPATIQRMAEHFQVLLSEIAADPNRRLTDLPILMEAERRQILVEWNDTRADYAQNVCVHQLFEAQAATSPNAIAVVCGDERLSYGELNSRANQLAHYLRMLGVGPESLVGLCMERSPEMIVSLWGILKAGGAYVPLDPAYPKDRLALMLADSQASVVVTQAQLAEGLPAYERPIVRLDADREKIAQASTKNPDSGVVDTNLAYVIYTSGSTGQPKGVTVAHRELVHHTLAFIEAHELDPSDRLLMFVSLNFDAAAAAVYPPLLMGARLVLPRVASSEMSGGDLAQFCEQEGITILQLAASFWHQWVDYLVSTGKPFRAPVKVLCTGGECPRVDKLQAWADLLKRPTKFLNAYGPTEAIITTTLYQIWFDSVTSRQLSQMPAGRPIPNKQIYLLDSHMQPVPIGVPGEVYVGGTGLARGYLGQPELTAEKFVPNPFAPLHLPSQVGGTRLYKTGDLARYLPGGNLEFIGRIDHQVKIRGFRIELGEIETVLEKHPAILRNIVTVREDVPGRKRLAAYLVARPGRPAPSAAEIRSYLKEILPDYMIPSAVVFLDALPLTPLGKVDLWALPAPDQAMPEGGSQFVAPRTAVERELARIWAQVLRVEQVGVQDNFFDLGGDSILSTQIVARANQAGLRITTRQLFQHQTIAELALVAGTAPVIKAEQGLVTGPVPLTPIQKWFLEQDMAEPHHWNQAILLRPCQPLNPVYLEKAAQALLAHHDALRLRFARQETGWQQTNAGLEDAPPFERIDLSAVPEPQQRHALEKEAGRLQASLNLTTGPLLRVALFDTGAPASDRVLIVVHHLAIDGISWRVLVEDLETAYRQLCEKAEESGTPASLPVLSLKTTSFQQWACRLTEYAQALPQLAQELAYWLAPSREQVDLLPVDCAGGENTEAVACTITASLTAEETHALLHEALAAYHSQITEVLLTALAQALRPWTRARSLLVDLEGHGREDLFEDIDLSRTVGWFTSYYPVLLDLGQFTQDPSWNPAKALRAIAAQIQAIPNRGLGYGLLRYLGPSATASKLVALPQAQVSFNYLGQFDSGSAGAALLEWVQENAGQTRSRAGRRTHALEINGRIVGGQLYVDWIYSQNLHRSATITALANQFIEALRTLIEYSKSPEAWSLADSDVDLDKVLAEINLDE